MTIALNVQLKELKDDLGVCLPYSRLLSTSASVFQKAVIYIIIIEVETNFNIFFS